ncbi:hypothetical protein F885_03005, partial [Acinetobacter higginsii]
DVSQTDCQNYMRGNRPFDYSKQPRAINTGIAQSGNYVASTSNQDTPMTPEQYAKYLQYLDEKNRANNIVYETQTLKSKDIGVNSL